MDSSNFQYNSWSTLYTVQNIIHDKTGWVVPKRNPKALAQKIIEVRDMSLEIKQSISKTAMHRVKADFNLEVQEKLFLEFYSN